MYGDDWDEFDDDDEDLDGDESGPDAESTASMQLIHDIAAGHSGVRCSAENL